MSYYYRGSRPLTSARGRGRGAWRERNHPQEDRPDTFSRYDDDTGVRVEYDRSNVLEIRHPRNYSGDAEVMEKPKVLGSYSVDNERDFGHDHSMLHFLDTKYVPDNGKMLVNLDLTKGWDKFNRYSGNAEESFQNFLRWILNNQSSVVDDSGQRLSVDFVSVRGNFTKFMRTPYNYVSPWTMFATEFKGSVYLINWKRDEEVTAQDNPVMDDVSKWGHTFEHYMRGGDPEDGIDANEEYRCVLKTNIGNISLLYAPEVDCVDPELYEEDFEDLQAFVLVKCCKELIEPKQKKNHKRFKLNQLWVENQLSGIPRTLIGYRNNEGKVHTIQLYQTDDLPEICEEEWDPNVCLNFLVRALTFIKEKVSTAPGTTFRFDREAKGHLFCTKLSGEDHIDLLPKWFTDGLFADDSDDESS